MFLCDVRSDALSAVGSAFAVLGSGEQIIDYRGQVRHGIVDLLFVGRWWRSCEVRWARRGFPPRGGVYQRVSIRGEGLLERWSGVRFLAAFVRLRGARKCAIESGNGSHLG